MTIYEFMTILDMQTDASAKVMDTLCVPVKIGDNQPYYWGVFIRIAPLLSINKIQLLQNLIARYCDPGLFSGMYNYHVM